MTIITLNSLLDRLDELKQRFDARASSAVEKTLARLKRHRFSDADSLIRYHELLLFVRAYPQNPTVLKLADTELASFSRRVEILREAEADLSPMESPEVSGIAGTSVTDTFTYPIVRWLVGHQPNRVNLDWDWFEDDYRLAATWPRFMPLLDEDASVEANVPYPEWLRAAAGRNKALAWLVQRFESLPKTDREKAELYESQKLYVGWSPSYRASRSGMRLAQSKRFYHREPLIQRRDVSLSAELEKPSPPLKLVSRDQGKTILNMAREASTVRYRELYGFTHGDPRRVFKAELGRGVEVFIAGLPPERRLPLRAYHAAMIFKNGVAVGYFEGLSLFERMESGFNLYYTFRDGETAWLYAKTLNLFRHLAGVTAFAIDPYQIGFENEEGIESGAFWFYRKQGFRPIKPEILKLVEREEQRIATRKGYRTSARTLRKIAAGPMIFEMNQSATGDWDRFQVRNIGLAVAKRMGAEFGVDTERAGAEAVESLSRSIGIPTKRWRETELRAVTDLAVALLGADEVDQWNAAEKDALVQVIRSKANADESRYLKLMQQHEPLRKLLIRLGFK